MGFNGAGLAIALVVLTPSLLILAFPPRPAVPEPTSPRIFTLLERVGQAGCLVAPTSFSGTAPTGPAGFLVVMLVALALYYALWLRYLTRGRLATLLFAPLGPLPLPMAALPVLVFGCTALWMPSLGVGAAAVVLAIGHLTVSGSIRSQQKSRHDGTVK